MQNSVHAERMAGALLESIHPQQHAHARHLFVIAWLAISKISRENNPETTFQIISGIYEAVFWIKISRVSHSRLRIGALAQLAKKLISYIASSGKELFCIKR